MTDGYKTFILFKILTENMLIDFREKGIREGKREGEKHQCEEHPLVAPCMHPDEGLNLNLGLCPDQELNL